MAKVIPLADRFATKYEPVPEAGCWLWIGGTNEHGYGIIGLGSRADGVAKAHRVSWELSRGPIPAGLSVLHKCDTPACVNPDHLWLGTKRGNSRDMARKGRHRIPDNRGERSAGAKLTAAAVACIRLKEKTGKEYARLFGVSKSAIYEIWRGKNWAA